MKTDLFHLRLQDSCVFNCTGTLDSFTNLGISLHLQHLAPNMGRQRQEQPRRHHTSKAISTKSTLCGRLERQHLSASLPTASQPCAERLEITPWLWPAVYKAEPGKNKAIIKFPV